jgi:CRISPR/Cas system CSM-associated protein Csm4 (group 5 of RAMP superfamily)
LLLQYFNKNVEENKDTVRKPESYYWNRQEEEPQDKETKSLSQMNRIQHEDWVEQKKAEGHRLAELRRPLNKRGPKPMLKTRRNKRYYNGGGGGEDDYEDVS